MSAMPTWSVDKLMRRIMRLEGDLRTLQTTPRLANSSLDGGAITINDPETGNPLVILGEQSDGTSAVVHVAGPPPPVPSTPIVSSDLGSLQVEWDGAWATDLLIDQPVAPLDFSRVEIHISTDSGFTPDLETTLRTTVESPRGGRVRVAVPYDQTQYVRLVARSLSGKGSDPSAEASGVARQIADFDVAEAALIVTKFKTNQHMIF